MLAMLQLWQEVYEMAGIGPSVSGVSWGLPFASGLQAVPAIRALTAPHAAPLALLLMPSISQTTLLLCSLLLQHLAKLSETLLKRVQG